MENKFHLTNQIEAVQLNSAASKHANRMLRYNPDYGTLDLLTVNMSGSYLRNPVGTFRLHSAKRLSYPKSSSDEDIIRIFFHKEDELFSLDISQDIFNCPKKLISALQTLGISFTSTLPSSQLGKLLGDYIARELTFDTLITCPGWGYFPKDSTELKFLFPENIPDSISTKDLKSLKIYSNGNLDMEDIHDIFKINNLYSHSVELKILFLLRLTGVLQTLFSKYQCNLSKIMNIILEQDVPQIKEVLVSFLSIYRNKAIYPLPMRQKELNKIMKTTNDDFIFFNISRTPLLSYQRTLLTDNLNTLLHTQESSHKMNHFIPVVFSSGTIPDLSPEYLISIPLDSKFTIGIESVELSALGRLTVKFITFAEKHLDLIENTIMENKGKYKTFQDNLLIALLSTYKIFQKFLLIYTTSNPLSLKLHSLQTNQQIVDYLNSAENIENIMGISEQFINHLLKCIANGEIKVQSTSVCWEPHKNANADALIDDDFIYITPETFDDIIKNKFSQTLPLTVLKQLYADNLIIADTSGKFHYKKKAGYLSSSGKIRYHRFVVIKRSLITPLHGPKLI